MSNLYIYEQGSVLKYNSNRLVIHHSDKEHKSIPIEHVDNVIVFGGVKISTPCIQQLLKRGIHVTWLSKSGSYFGRLEATDSVNVERQRLQFRKSEDENFSLGVSKQFIKGKTQNQRTILMRANKIIKNENLNELIHKMNIYLKNLDKVKTKEKLMGMEGYLTKLYYEGLNIVLKPEFAFKTRTKRPPKDPFNSIISFGYTLLHYELFSIIKTKGLNPYIAFLHSDRNNHSSLCSDLIEEWRPILVDSLAVNLLNNEKIKKIDFKYNKDNKGVFLGKDGCKIFIKEYEKRIRQEVGYVQEVSYKMSFRKILEYQISRLIKSMENDDPELYKAILIR